MKTLSTEETPVSAEETEEDSQINRGWMDVIQTLQSLSIDPHFPVT